MYTWALIRVSATTSGAAVTLVPLFALALSSLVLGEPVTINAVVSALLILSGLTAYALAQRRADPARHRVGPMVEHPAPAEPR
ncbi:MAG: hypothetical protein DLM61_27490 [Pseudonocardiales bacterium]|nr:DMT family transporter [Pseudonocardiales bacterium]PZS21724.1 MAG: hypothetical protein DLM61_27490 [Pseudonocardiales bacterium]